MAQSPETLDRRGFLKLMMALAAAGAAYGDYKIMETLAGMSSSGTISAPTPEPTPEPKVAYAVPDTPTPRPTPRPTPEATPTRPPAISPKEVVSGIEVYRVEDKAEQEALNTQLRHQFEQRHGLILSDDEETRFRQVREKLHPWRRFLQMGVSQSLYTRFKAEAKATGINLVTWIALHVSEMNHIIARLDPSTKLRAELARIVVYNEKAFDYTNPEGIVGIDYPVDIDGWFGIWTDLRGIIEAKLDPETQQPLRSSYLFEKNMGGRTVVLDYGLIHELFHQLFNTPDEYMMDVTTSNPSLVLLADGLDKGLQFLLPVSTRRTSFIAWYLGEIEKLNVRGYYRDERAMGIAGDRAGRNSVEDIFGLHPENITLSLVDFNFQPISGRVRPVRLAAQHSYYADSENPKKPERLPEQSLVNGRFKLTPDYFKPQRFVAGGASYVIYPTNWYFEIRADKGNIYKLHLPSAPFIMSSLAGKKDNATYTIRLHNPNSNFSGQFLEMATLSELKVALPGVSEPYATMQVDGTNDFLLWYT